MTLLLFQLVFRSNTFLPAYKPIIFIGFQTSLFVLHLFPQQNFKRKLKQAKIKRQLTEKNKKKKGNTSYDHSNQNSKIQTSPLRWNRNIYVEFDIQKLNQAASFHCTRRGKGQKMRLHEPFIQLKEQFILPHYTPTLLLPESIRIVNLLAVLVKSLQ